MRLLHPEILSGFLCISLMAGTAFDPVKDVAITVSGGKLMLSMPSGAHLKVAHFKVALKGPGTLEVGPLPAPSGTDDAGDPIWRGRVVVPLAAGGMADSSALEITYQPCTEGPEGQCYLPLKRILKAAAADLTPAAPAPAKPNRS